VGNPVLLSGSRMGRALAACVVLAVAGLAFASAAQASSIVYIKNSNVWLANPDGSGQYQVTTNGTSSDPYLYPTQANDGTIMAQRGKGVPATLYRMNQNGTLQAPGFGTAAPTSGPIDPVISPDANKVAYYFVSVGCCGTESQTQISYSNHTTDPSVFNPNNTLYEDDHPAWLSNSRLVFPSNDVTAFDLGASAQISWFSWFDVFKDANGNAPGACYAIGSFDRVALSPDGSMLAVLNRGSGYSPPFASTCDASYWNTVSNNASIMFLKTAGDAATGNPPAKPTLQNCLIPPPDNTDGFPGGAAWNTPPPDSTRPPLFDSISWAPDGSAVAFEYNGDTYVDRLVSWTDCTSWTVTKIIPGGTHPFWGPANVNPAPRPTPGGGGGGTSGSGGSGGNGANGGKHACHVPNVIGKRLGAARTALSGAHCNVGKVTKRHAKRKKKGKVLSETPAAGAKRNAGAKVDLVIGK
jgi:hypothetical protein